MPHTLSSASSYTTMADSRLDLALAIIISNIGGESVWPGGYRSYYELIEVCLIILLDSGVIYNNKVSTTVSEAKA